MAAGVAVLRRLAALGAGRPPPALASAAYYLSACRGPHRNHSHCARGHCHCHCSGGTNSTTTNNSNSSRPLHQLHQQHQQPYQPARQHSAAHRAWIAAFEEEEEQHRRHYQPTAHDFGARFYPTDPIKVMAEALPATQKAAVFDEFGGKLEVRDIPLPEIGADDILVKVMYSGVCHTDLHAWLGDFPLPCKKPPIVGGHEGAGIVVKVGSNVKNFKLGDRAGIKWINGSCLCCEQCKRGSETTCTNCELSGYTRDGSFQQYAAVKGTEAAPIPDGVDLATAAPILCAGVTVYKALKESGVAAGEIVAITGAGGGLGSLCIQYAKAMGMRVLAIDAGIKEQHCRTLGADDFIDPFATKDLVTEIQRRTGGGPHGVINVAAADKPMEDSCKYVRTKGTVVLVALPRDGKVNLDVFWTVVRMITVKGSYVGTRQDTEEALGFFARGLVKIPTEIQPLSALPQVYERMQKLQIQGRIVLDLWK